MHKRDWIIACVGVCLATAAFAVTPPDLTQNPAFLDFLSGVANDSDQQSLLNQILHSDWPDLSLRMLYQIFGSVGGALPSDGYSPGLIASIFLIFNAGILGLAGLLVAYTTGMGAFETSTNGSVMGQKYLQSWTFMRSVVGVAMLVPKFNGYSFVQILAMWVIVISVRMADAVWNVAVNFMQTQPIVSSLVLPTIIEPSSGITQADYQKFGTVVGKMLDANYCMISQNHRYANSAKLIVKHVKSAPNPYVFTRPSQANQYTAYYGSSNAGNCQQIKLLDRIVVQSPAEHLILTKKVAAFEALNSVVYGIANEAYQAVIANPLLLTSTLNQSTLHLYALRLAEAETQYLQFLTTPGTGSQSSAYTAALQTGWISAGWNYHLLLPAMTYTSTLASNALIYGVPTQFSVRYPWNTQLIQATNQAIGIVDGTPSASAAHAPIPDISIAGKALAPVCTSADGTTAVACTTDAEKAQSMPTILASLYNNMNKIVPSSLPQASQFGSMNVSQNLSVILAQQRSRSTESLQNAWCSNVIYSMFHPGGCGSRTSGESSSNSDSSVMSWMGIKQAASEITDQVYDQDVQIFFYQIIGAWANVALPSQSLYQTWASSGSAVVSKHGEAWLNIGGPHSGQSVPIDPISRMGYFGDQLLFASVNFAIHASLDIFVDVYSRGLYYTRKAFEYMGYSMMAKTAGQLTFMTGHSLLGFILTAPIGVFLMGLGLVLGGVGGGFAAMAANQVMYFKLEMHHKFMYLPVVLAVAIPIMVSGATMSFYVRLIPFVMYTLVVIGWFISVFETMVAAPLVAMGVTHPEGHDFLGQAEQAQILMASIFIRPIAIVISFIAATALSFVLMWLVNTSFVGIMYSSFASFTGATTALDVANNTGATYTDAIWLLTCLMVYIYITMSVLEYCFSMLHEVPYMLVRWIGGQREQGQEDQLMLGIAQGIQSQAQSLGQGMSGTVKSQQSKFTPTGGAGMAQSLGGAFGL